MDFSEPLPEHRRDLAGRHLGARPRRSHGLRQPRDRADAPDRGVGAGRADRLRHPRRAGAGAVPRAPGRRARGPGERHRGRGAVGAQRRRHHVGAVPGDGAARRRGAATGAAAPLLRRHRAARADRVAAGERGRARRPGRAEQPHAGGRQRRQRGELAGRRAACRRARWCCCTTTGSGPGPSSRRPDGSGQVEPFYPPQAEADRELDRDDPFAAVGARARPAGLRRARGGLGRPAADHRVPGAARQPRCTPSW